jgi:hypothetical protein
VKRYAINQGGPFLSCRGGPFFGCHYREQLVLAVAGGAILNEPRQSENDQAKEADRAAAVDPY